MLRVGGLPKPALVQKKLSWSCDNELDYVLDYAALRLGLSKGDK